MEEDELHSFNVFPRRTRPAFHPLPALEPPICTWPGIFQKCVHTYLVFAYNPFWTFLSIFPQDVRVNTHPLEPIHFLLFSWTSQVTNSLHICLKHLQIKRPRSMSDSSLRLFFDSISLTNSVSSSFLFSSFSSAGCRTSLRRDELEERPAPPVLS